MAPRVFLLCILFTVGLLAGQNIGAARLDTTLGFTRQPQDVVAVRSRPLTLHCEVSSTLPEYNVTWLRDGQPLLLTADSRRQLLANGSLYFKKVQYKRAGAHDSSDQGEYRCMARNAVGAVVSGPAQLRVAVLGNNFNEFPSNTTVKAGDAVRFTCQIDSVPKALITWERNREPLPHNSRMLTLDSGDLYLLNIRSTDEGTYRCTAINVINKKQRVSPEILLRVMARSEEDSSQVLQFLNPHVPTVQLHQGKTLLLPCAVVGSLTPEITWTFKSINSSESDVLNHTKSALSLLTIHNVTLENAGNYTCSATASNRDTIYQMVEVDVWVPPYFKANGTPISESHPAAKTVRFKCDAQGIPKPEITWYKDGERLEINGRFKQRASELVLLNAVTTDSGLYQCVVHSKAGELWAVGRLQVNSSRAMPDPPHSPSCVTLSASQIQLTWEPPQRYTGDKIVAYSIHFAPADGGDERQEVKVNRTFTVDKLAAYTNYSFYVRAYNGKSASDPSTRIVCQTGEEVPQAAPDFDVNITSSSTSRVSWKVLPNEKARGLITEYKIQWRRLGHPSSNVEEVKGDVMEYTITGLQPGQTYEVRVLAATKKGWPDPTDQLLWKVINMPSFGPENVPEAPIVNLTAINSSCIEVTWNLPTDNQYPATDYKLFYRKQTSQQIGPILLPANVTYYILDGLEPQTLYEVHVVGVGASGDGGVGVQSIHTRPDSSLQFLAPPGNLQAEPISSTIINLTWIPPNSVLDVAYYNVSYSSVAPRQGSDDVVHYIQTSGTGVEIGGLRPFTLYEFKVCTHDHHNRYGPYSQKLECRTMEGIPSVVRDVQCKPLNSSTMRVTWKEPIQTNGIVSGYAVLYSDDAALPLDGWKVHKVPGNKISTEVTELEPKTRYFLQLRAATQAGWGDPSGLPPSSSCTTTDAPDEPSEEVTVNTLQSPQHLGIVVGVTIAAGCILVCMGALLWKRCSARRRRRRRRPQRQAESGVQHVNGNGYYRDWERPQETEMQESELHLATLAPNIPPANHSLLDTKGGYPNGQVNGLRHSFLSNGRIPNGHGNRSKCSVHITENPQVRPSYNCSDSPGQLLSSQESKVDDDRAMPDQEIPLLQNSHSSSVRGEDHTELEDDVEFDQDTIGGGLNTANSTQLTDLDVSLNGNNCTGTSSHNNSNRNGNSGSLNSSRDRSSSSTDCVVPKPSHLSVPQ